MMKAIGGSPLSLVAAAVLGLTTVACSDRVIPPPVPVSQPRPVKPVPQTAPVPRPAINWQDAPITPGDWTWAMDGNASVASFAGGTLQLRCAAGQVTLRRSGSAAIAMPVTVITSSVTRTLSGSGTAGIDTAIPARDPLLDAIAFSRGRFAVDVAGLPMLYVPSWPEISRVVEDCRA